MKRRTTKLLGLMAGLICSLLVHPAGAVDDGGGRSVFARGAGERALALGGAYVAVADDPGAMIWNPAGLARLDRKSLFASHTNLIGMGFSEQSGLLALPSWRLGTVGLGVRRFGVDGIEGRDDRGAVFDDNLSDAETELLLGYGRTLGGGWQLGATFKYQQQSLAGYSDGAPGLDLGVMVKPLQVVGGHSAFAEALTVGLAIRNLIEPNLRLDEDGVKDPTGLRFGVAVDRALGANIRVLAASDVEKTREMDLRVHAGFELELMDLLALRVGTNAGVMSAGAGVHYRNLTLDYAFEDNVLETVHRFGLGIAFGATTAENRQASLDAQSAEFQGQLATVYQQQNEDRVRAIVDEARQALARGDYVTALGRAEAVRVLDPVNPRLKGIEAAAFYVQGNNLEEAGDLSGAAIAYQRCLASDSGHVQAATRLETVSARSNQLAARGEEIRRHFDAALEAYARGDLIVAKDGFTRVVTLNPGDRESAALLRNTSQTLELRAGSLLEQAAAQAAAHSFAAAKASLETARNLDPNHRLLARTTTAIAAAEAEVAAASRAAARNSQAGPAIEDGQAAVVPAATYAALSAKDQQEMADLYQRGLAAVENNRHDDAIRYWELVWVRAPDYQQVAENLKQEYLVQGLEAFAAGRLDQSIVIWEKAQTVAPNDPKARGYLARAYEHKSRIQEIKGTE
jgi:hypothetical protein